MCLIHCNPFRWAMLCAVCVRLTKLFLSLSSNDYVHGTSISTFADLNICHLHSEHKSSHFLCRISHFLTCFRIRNTERIQNITDSKISYIALTNTWAGKLYVRSFSNWDLEKKWDGKNSFPNTVCTPDILQLQCFWTQRYGQYKKDRKKKRVYNECFPPLFIVTCR